MSAELAQLMKPAFRVACVSGDGSDRQKGLLSTQMKVWLLTP